MKQGIIVIPLLLLSTIFAYSQPSGYSFGKEITLQSSQVSGSSALSNFPVLISFTDANLRTTGNGGNVQNGNGYDIIFTSDCLTQLDHQIERYNGTTGEYVAWVKIPSLSPSTNTVIYMYYGNASVSANPSTTNVWDANYVGVWHLNGGNFNDATATGNNGTNSGSTNVTAAKIAGARSFATNGSYVRIPTNGWSVASGTISLWGNVTAFSGTRHQYFFGHTTQPSYGDRIQIYADDAAGNLDVGLGDNHFAATNIQAISTGQWHYIVLTWSGGNFNVFVDGLLRRSTTYLDLSALHTFAHIGKQGNEVSPPTPDESQNGTIDEVRVSNIVRSADWIQTQYNNQNTPSSFYTVSSQMTAAATCALPIHLSQFEAVAQEGKVKLLWTTATETQNDYFTIERSPDGTNWEEVKTIDGAGNSVTTLTYQAWDEHPYGGLSYYRLKQTDYDGMFTHSWIRSVTIERKFNVYPNPATNEFSVGPLLTDNYSITLFNSLGQAVEVTTVASRGMIVVNASGLKRGVYLLVVSDGNAAHRKMIVLE